MNILSIYVFLISTPAVSRSNCYAAAPYHCLQKMLILDIYDAEYFNDTLWYFLTNYTLLAQT